MIESFSGQPPTWFDSWKSHRIRHGASIIDRKELEVWFVTGSRTLRRRDASPGGREQPPGRGRTTGSSGGAGVLPSARPLDGHRTRPSPRAFGPAPYNIYSKVLNGFSRNYAFPYNEQYGGGGNGNPLLTLPTNGEYRMTLPSDGFVHGSQTGA